MPKPKNKLKAKAKPKAKAKKIVKAKKKLAPKKITKVKAKAKKTLKPKKIVAKKKVTPKKAKAATKPKAKKASKPRFTKIQKADLLTLIGKIVNLRKHNIDGLKSFDAIDHILDQYNQKYTDANQKLDAIVELGMERHKKTLRGLIAVADEGRDAVSLYHLLAEIGKGNGKFSEFIDKLNSIHEEALEMHRTRHVY
jgi:hypothetical protein